MTAKHLQSGITPQLPMEVSTNIDWISCTYPLTARLAKKPLVLPDDHHNGFLIVKPVNGYQSAIQYQSGAIEMWHGNHESMGCHVIYSGQAIRNACEQFNCEQHEILDYLMLGAKIVRLDLALDVKNVPINIQNIHEDFKRGNIKSRVKKSQYTESAESGNEKGASTVYFGSTRKRKKLLRVYDKGAQLGLDIDLTRFEIECHHEIANNAAKTVMRDIGAIGKTIAGIIRGYVDLTKQVPDGVFNAESIKVSLPKYRKSNTAQWLTDVVSKTLANEVFNDYAVLDDFMSHFKYHYEQLLAERGFNEA